MDLINKKIGIWGFGIVGQSVATFLSGKQCHIEILDKKAFTSQQLTFFVKNNITSVHEKNLKSFLDRNEYIIPSPGINISTYYNEYAHKWITELDIFAHYFKKPIIAITGSVGKTTVTTLLSSILKQYYKKIVTGGNIGIGSLDLIDYHDATDGALLEVSSFQLAYTTQFAPDLAIITNFSPNHLDWHGSIENYLTAKLAILAHQNDSQKALLPLEFSYLFFPQKNLSFFSITKPTVSELSQLNLNQTIFFIDNNWIIKYQNQQRIKLFNITLLPNTTFMQNWLIIISALDLLDLPINNISEYVKSISLPEHRLERVTTINNIIIYNDSKATTPAATLAAVEKLQGSPIHLFLGGLSKGTNREPLIRSLKNKVKRVYCFGAQAQELASLCNKYTIACEFFSTLEPAFTSSFSKAIPGDQILFSPAGSSFDLFDNYEHRGTAFKFLVAELIHKI